MTVSMKTLNSRGDRGQPWRTPVVIGKGGEVAELALAAAVVSV
jgi:hypothetical protein